MAGFASYDGEKLAKIARELKKINKQEIVIGLISGVADSFEVKKGFWNEYGTKHIPERSFIRSTVKENKTKYKNMVFSSVNAIIENGAETTPKLKRIGFEVEKDIKLKIKSLSQPPNAPATIAKKGDDNPLIDTGRMRNSIANKVREKGRL